MRYREQPQKEPRREGMDKRDPERVLEKIGEFTKEAISLYRKEIAGQTRIKDKAPDELPQREIADFQRRVKSAFARKDFSDFRKIIGTAAMRGEVKVDGRDAGLEVMRITFGEDDSRLFEDVMFLSRTSGIRIRDYTVTSMISLRDMLEQKIQLEGWEAVRKQLEVAGVSMRDLTYARYRLRHFLTEGAGPNVAEQILWREELEREPALVDMLNREFLTPALKKTVRSELRNTKEETAEIWDGIRGYFVGHPDFAGKKPKEIKKELVTGSPGTEKFHRQFEQLPRQITLLRLNLQMQKELEDELKGGQEKPALVPMDEAHIRASALVRMATQVLSEAESVRNPEKEAKLRERGLQDLVEAEELTRPRSRGVS